MLLVALLAVWQQHDHPVSRSDLRNSLRPAAHGSAMVHPVQL